MNDDHDQAQGDAEVFELLEKHREALDEYETYTELRDIAAVAAPEAPATGLGWDVPFSVCLRG